ncbi:MFS general substrate transporter [Corynespora cassiicola Philippines]|uniref:MFS general substrate transporter n=1 Tax=Corynespora cassiicola Philippines TaxID=1448308 RepID=A0A2T2NRQ4_CORCC|nr:MFS general substrate transporter [Corynespora cassiicola Philippines]
MWPFGSQSPRAPATLEGAGTADDPYLVDWELNDPCNPLSMRPALKWFVSAINAAATLVLAFGSSVYVSSVADLENRFGVAPETALLGASLYVVGFAVGPLLWAPLGELLGRRVVFVTAYGGFFACSVVAALADNLPLIIATRAIGGALGSVAMVNAGSVVGDMFSPAERGRVSAIFSSAPFFGPVLGPIVGGFLSQTAGWRGIGILIAALTGVLWLLYCAVVPETYSPVLLRIRAEALTRADVDGSLFRSRIDHKNGPKTLSQSLRVALMRPLVMLVSEAIVIVLSTYMAILYGALYLLFAAFPVIFQQNYRLPAGISGLAFLGIAVGVLLAVVYMFFQNTKYVKIAKASPGGKAPPEARLLPARLGAVAAPLGLFAFAITNTPPIPFYVPAAVTVPFGFGIVVIFLSLLNYLLDTYTIYAASAMATSTVVRSIFGAVFPLFARALFQKLGPQFGAAVPATLAAICVPFPFLFYRYGSKIREKSRLSQEARTILSQMGGKTEKKRPFSEGHGPTEQDELDNCKNSGSG